MDPKVMRWHLPQGAVLEVAYISPDDSPPTPAHMASILAYFLLWSGQSSPLDPFRTEISFLN